MAIDTAERRLSMLDVSQPATLPAPDGEIDGADRYHLLGLYSGFGEEGGEPEPPTPGSTWIHRARRRGRR